MDYRWIDKAPAIDMFRTAYLDSNMTHKEIATQARISPSTIENWLWGKTKNPQVRTFNAAMEVLGCVATYMYSDGRILEPRHGVQRKFAVKRSLKLVKKEAS